MNQLLEELNEDEMEGKNLPSIATRVYFWVVLTLACVFFGISVILTPQFYLIDWRDFLVFCLLIVLSEQTYVILPRGSKLSASFSIVLASMLLFNAPIAAILVAIGSSFTTLYQKRDWDVVFFNVSQYVISYLMAAGAMALTLPVLESIFGSFSLLNTLIGAGVATLVYMVTNIPLVNGYVALKDSPYLGLKGLTQHVFYWEDEMIEVTQTIFFYPIAVMVAEYYRNEHNLMILGVFIALILGGLRFIEQQRRIEHQNEKMRVLYELTKECGELILRETDIEVSDSDLFKALLKTTTHLQINKILPNHRCSVYRVEALDEELEQGRIVHQESNQVLEPERIYHLDDDGLLQDIVLGKKGVINNNLKQLPQNYIAWRWRYHSILAQPIMLDDEVAYILVLFREQGDPFDKNDASMMQLLVKPLEITLKNIQLRKKIQEQAIKDGLMGVFNHRYLKNKMEEELSRSKRYKNSLSLVIADVDYFKKFNDTHGHLLGDKVLKEIAQILMDSVRETDIVARYGGEELAILLPETSIDFACEVAERMRKNVATHAFTGKDNQTVSLSMSIGITCTDDDPDLQVSEMIVRADTALYKAKNQGRNQICRSLVEEGKLIIETYSKGEQPRLPDGTQSAESTGLKHEFQKQWFENNLKNISQMTTRFDTYVTKSRAKKRISEHFFKRKVIPQIPTLFEAFMCEYIQGDSTLGKAFVKHKVARFQNQLRQKVVSEENVFALQEALLIAYRYLMDQGLAISGNDENVKKQVLYYSFEFLQFFNQKLLAMCWTSLETLYKGAEALYQSSQALYQLKTGIKEQDTVLQNVLKGACEHLQLPGVAMLGLRSIYQHDFRLQAFWQIEEDDIPYLSRSQPLVIPEFLRKQTSHRLSVLEVSPETYLSQTTLDEHLPDLEQLMILPLVYQHHVYGVLLLGFPEQRELDLSQRQWLERFCRDLAIALHLNQLLGDANKRVIGLLKSQVDILCQAHNLDTLFAEKVSQMARRLARGLQLSYLEQEQIKDMAYLHHLGPLLFQDSPNFESQASSQTVLLTTRLFENSPVLEAFNMPLRHFREHWDGSGFPDALQAEQIPLYARIIGLAWAYERAMAKEPHAEQVVVKLKKSGHYDPDLCQLLEQLVTQHELKKQPI